MQDEDSKSNGEIGFSLEIREKFSTDRRNQEHLKPQIPEAYRYWMLRHGVIFDPEEIKIPKADSSIFLRLARKDASEEEIRATAGNFFDSSNIHLYQKSKGSLKALTDYSDSLAVRQQNLKKETEETPPLRSMYSANDLVKLSKSKRLFALFSLAVIIGLVVLEWSSQATLIQMSGDEVFLGDGGFFKALLVTPVLIIFTLFLKFDMKEVELDFQKKIGRYLLVGLSSCAITYFLAFSFYYGGMLSLEDDSLEMPPEFWRKLMIFAQLVLAPFSTMFIFNALEKRAEYHKEEAVFYNKKHLASDEEQASVVSRREDTDLTLSHLEGFRAVYSALREKYIEEFYGEYIDFQTEYLAVTYTALANFRKFGYEADRKPKLKIVGEEK